MRQRPIAFLLGVAVLASSVTLSSLKEVNHHVSAAL